MKGIDKGKTYLFIVFADKGIDNRKTYLQYLECSVRR